jgi:hypothetical protein
LSRFIAKIGTKFPLSIGLLGLAGRRIVRTLLLAFCPELTPVGELRQSQSGGGGHWHEVIADRRLADVKVSHLTLKGSNHD